MFSSTGVQCVQGPPETSALLVCSLDGESRAFALPGVK